MSDTKIEWADKTWNPVTGCTKVGEGCRHCYAARMSKRLAGRYGYPEETPFSVTVHHNKMDEPLSWKKPSRIFVCSMGDLFHPDVPFDVIQQVFSTMEATPHYTYMILTKRPDRMREFIAGAWDEVTEEAGEVGYYEPSPHIWLGVSAWDQESADRMIPPLLATPASVRFVSLEPLLGPVDLTKHGNGLPKIGTTCPNDGGKCHHHCNDEDGCFRADGGGSMSSRYLLDWVIVGGETGPGARPMHPDWVRSIRDQCAVADVPFFFKSWGEWAYCRYPDDPGQIDPQKLKFFPAMDAAFWRIGKKSAGRLLDGKTHDAYSWVGPIDEDKANARLVAATPDLLEAVQAALLREDLGEELASVLRAARDKAVGDGL